MFTPNEDVHALTQKSSRILPITPLKLRLETITYKQPVEEKQRPRRCDTLKSILSKNLMKIFQSYLISVHINVV